MEKKKIGIVHYIRNFCEAGAIFFIYPFLVITLSLINYIQGHPVNVYLFAALLTLSTLFAFFSWGGDKIEREEKAIKNKKG